jgi:hypothetical protein
MLYRIKQLSGSVGMRKIFESMATVQRRNCHLYLGIADGIETVQHPTANIALSGVSQRGVRLAQQGAARHGQKKALRKAIAEFDQAGWIAMNARLMLYAADPVKDAVEAGNVAHNEVMRLGHEWNRWLDDIRKIIEAAGPQAIPAGLVDVEIEAKERMMLAPKAAFRAESALIEVLQSDMSGPRPRTRMKGPSCAARPAAASCPAVSRGPTRAAVTRIGQDPRLGG